jgi:hypothetical protein
VPARHGFGFFSSDAQVNVLTVAWFEAVTEHRLC